MTLDTLKTGAAIQAKIVELRNQGVHIIEELDKNDKHRRELAARKNEIDSDISLLARMADAVERLWNVV